MPGVHTAKPALFATMLLATLTAGCAQQESISDPFAWCAQQDSSEIVEGQFPETLINAMVTQGLVSADAPPQFQQANLWRCMDGAVWVCPLGANLPCSEKADLSREPTPAMSDWCNDSPGAAIPAYVTGRATVYSWTCDGTKPVIEKQQGTADKAGYLAEFWYRLNRPQG